MFFYVLKNSYISNYLKASSDIFIYYPERVIPYFNYIIIHQEMEEKSMDNIITVNDYGMGMRALNTRIEDQFDRAVDATAERHFKVLKSKLDAAKADRLPYLTKSISFSFREKRYRKEFDHFSEKGFPDYVFEKNVYARMQCLLRKAGFACTHQDDYRDYHDGVITYVITWKR